MRSFEDHCPRKMVAVLPSIWTVALILPLDQIDSFNRVTRCLEGVNNVCSRKNKASIFALADSVKVDSVPPNEGHQIAFLKITRFEGVRNITAASCIVAVVTGEGESMFSPVFLRRSVKANSHSRLLRLFHGTAIGLGSSMQSPPPSMIERHSSTKAGVGSISSSIARASRYVSDRAAYPHPDLIPALVSTHGFHP